MIWLKAVVTIQINSSEGQGFIEMIYLNPQCLLKYHQNSMGKRIVCSGLHACTLLYMGSDWDKLDLIVIDNLLPTSKYLILKSGHTNRLAQNINS